MHRQTIIARTAAILCGVYFGTGSACPGQDVKNAVEPPIVGRYEGSTIRVQSQQAFDRVNMTTRLGAQGKFEGITVEGRHSLTVLQGPRGRSALEIFTNYANALNTAGFQTVFRCSREQCPRGMFQEGLGPDAYSGIRRPFVLSGDGSIEDQHYMVASRITPAGTEYARLVAGGPRLPVTVVEIVQPSLMETRVKVMESATMKSELAQRGRVALYAIFFDFDKAELKPESKPQLEELAKYLRSEPAAKVFVVGHTDGKGTLEYNTDLSRRRAIAVAGALVNDYQISAARLSAHGAGPLAPVASNDTEEGRTLNRRVEVVKRLE